MSEEQQTHPIIELIKSKCKELGVKAEQIQRVSLDDDENGGKPTFIWAVSVPGIGNSFMFTNPGDIANALTLSSIILGMHNLKEAGIDPTAEKLDLGKPQIVIGPEAQEQETLDEVLQETELEEEPDIMPPPEVHVEAPAGTVAPATIVKAQTPVIGAMSFEDRQAQRAASAGRPGGFKKTEAGPPVVAAGGTLV